MQYPKATLREIEQALDERFYRLRARMLQSRGAALPTDLASQLLARTEGNAKLLHRAIDVLQRSGDPVCLMAALADWKRNN